MTLCGFCTGALLTFPAATVCSALLMAVLAFPRITLRTVVIYMDSGIL